MPSGLLSSHKLRLSLRRRSLYMPLVESIFHKTTQRNSSVPLLHSSLFHIINEELRAVLQAKVKEETWRGAAPKRGSSAPASASYSAKSPLHHHDGMLKPSATTNKATWQNSAAGSHLNSQLSKCQLLIVHADRLRKRRV